MVTTSSKNIKQIAENEEASVEIFPLDAQKIDTKNLSKKTVIVTEGMLGKNFSSGTINHSAVLQERKQLTELYHHFFQSSYSNKNIDSIACCFPFWNIGKESIYMPLFDDFSTQWKVSSLCRSSKRYMSHMRPGQYVGREILILERS